MDYNFSTIEAKWQKYWKQHNTYKVDIDHCKPKFYVLDMFPYPSGAGLHVGHPLGYIASDIYARYKRLNGFNVLHPMGFDAFGLPAEQYAIQTGQHPAVTTEKNIARYKEQLEKIGFSYDWSREVQTCDPDYYKWTQWTFIKLFHSWYNKTTDRAESIAELEAIFRQKGNLTVNAACAETPAFSAHEWHLMHELEQQKILMNYRLAYISDVLVNWCTELGTVLANDEVSNGYSIRGGHPVERKLMRQWLLRITAYADRLLEGLNQIDWSDSLKEMQRNWIGRSEGAEVTFRVEDEKGIHHDIEIFTTRPDTIFGATFMVLAPEHSLVGKITPTSARKQVDEYVRWASNRSERERQSEVKNISGVFTGAFAINPLNNQKIPVWVADYVLMGYGTGAIMSVPGHDSRDFAFARHFDLPILQVVCQTGETPSDPSTWTDSYDSKDGFMINSGFINGMAVRQAVEATINYIEKYNLGRRKVNFRLRDAIFSRQRYWGEPFPVYYKNGMPYTLDEKDLPLRLPPVSAFLPTEAGDPPLARAGGWKNSDGDPFETNTMPGFAGSSGYYLRYMDPRNDNEYFSRDTIEYWQNVDLYVGGAEHATGHLLYARFWNKFLFDLGLVVKEEPFTKLINQGMIQGRSNLVYRIKGTNTFVSHGLKDGYETIPMHTDVSLTTHDILDTDAFRQWRPDLSDADFILENGQYVCGWEIEKMSKSLHNIINPDDLIEKYGADTLRLYEMFLGPLEQSKPWDTSGIEGIFRFIRKCWRLFHDADNKFSVSDESPTRDELRILHRTVRKVREDIERFNFNTAVSAFMICVNDLTETKCNKRAILEPLVVLLSPYSPHLSEELWHRLGHDSSVCDASYPEFSEEYLIDNTFEYPVSFNGKLRFKINLPVDMAPAEIEKVVLEAEESQKWLKGGSPKKIIIVPQRIINVVV